MTTEKLLLRAIAWAREAGRIQMEYFRTSRLDLQTKNGQADVVTVADKAAERSIIENIRREMPGHSVLAEESGETVIGNGSWRWIIDPLDGTTNFSQGLPMFSVSIALEHNGNILLGVVYAPYLEELFHAVAGEGAFLNGKQIRCSDKTNLDQSVAATGFPVDKDHNPDNNIANFSRIAPKLRGIRRLGSAALDLCYTAAGFLDAYWELKLHHWDIAAGALIAREAGANVELLRPENDFSILASSPGIFPELRGLID